MVEAIATLEDRERKITLKFYLRDTHTQSWAKKLLP